MSLFDSIVKISSGMTETGLLMMDSALKTMQSSMQAMAGLPAPKRATRPPYEGPQDLDSAVSEFANRAARIARVTVLDQKEYTQGMQEVLKAFRHCFNWVNLSDPRSAIVPMQLPLSVGTLMTQSGLRGLASFSVVGAKRFPEFVANVYEMFTEVQFYVSVQYDELLLRYEKRLAEQPNDSRTRVEYGKILNKLGRYRDASEVLRQASEDPTVYAWALHERAVSNFRGGNPQQAVRDAAASLAANPTNDRTRFILWHAAQKAGGYPPEVPEELRMELKVGLETPSVQFEDVAAKIGLDKTSAGRGLAVFDFNNDGYLDVMIAAAHAGCSLFKNNGNGTFTDVSVGSGLDECVNGFAIAIGDYNNDGFDDVFVSRLGFYVGDNALYRNNGDGTFTNVTEEAGLGSWGPCFTPSFIDYNNDGLLDIYVTSNLGGLFDRKSKNLLFRNNGDGTFTEVSQQAGLKTIWPTIGAAWGDYNNDGLPDLFVSNAMGRSQLFRNNGDGTFTDVSAEAGVDQEFVIGSTCFWCDYNNDGWMDIVQFAWSDHEDVIHTMKTGHGPEDGHPLRLYRNNGDGTFTMVSREHGIDGCWGTMSGNCGDFNNDGNIDFLLGNGSPRMDRTEPPILLEFDGDQFHNVTFAAGFPFTGKGHGGNFADLNGDGRLDILVASGGAYPGDLLTTSVFRAKKHPGNYINVRVKGTKSNPNGLGTRVCVIAGGKKQYREVTGGSNFGCLPYEQHFGLGKLESIEAIELRWPSGLTQRIENPPINKTIRIIEGQDNWEGVYTREWAKVAAD